MNESELSHRGLMKLANAKLDYLLEMSKVERFVQRNGETDDILRYASNANDKYNNRVRQIYAEDKSLKLN